LFGQKSGQFVRTLGFTEEITLDEITALVAEEFQLLPGFDPFGNHAQLEAMGQGNDRLGNGRTVTWPTNALNEAFINL
jgi:hypothetical protein